MVDLQLHHFAAVAGKGRHIVETTYDKQGVEHKTIVKAPLKFGDRIAAVRQGGSFLYGDSIHKSQNVRFKMEFYEALKKAEGLPCAEKAVRQAGLKTDFQGGNVWIHTPGSFGGRMGKLLDKAQSHRLSNVKANDAALTAFFDPNEDIDSFSDVLENCIDFSFGDADEDKERAANEKKEIRRFIERDIKSAPDYGLRSLGQDGIAIRAKTAIRKFYEAKADAFDRSYPDLATIRQEDLDDYHADGRFFDALKNKIGSKTDEANIACEALDKIRDNKKLLREMSYDPTQWADLETRLSKDYDALVELADKLDPTWLQLRDDPSDGGSEIHEGRLVGDDVVELSDEDKVYKAITLELSHQAELLHAKLRFVQDVHADNPLSMKAVAYSNLIWAKAAERIFDKAILQADGENKTNLEKVRDDLLTSRKDEYNKASPDMPVETPSKHNKNTHPAVLGRSDTLTHIQRELKGKIPNDLYAELATNGALKNAHREALDRNPDWKSVSRRLILTRGEVVGDFHTEIKAAPDINGRFRRDLRKDDPTRVGMSAAGKDEGHARNLKVSSVARHNADGTETTLGVVVGAGIVANWGIKNKIAREQANKVAAQEVLTAALCSNERVFDTALNRATDAKRTGVPAKAVKVTNVSVSLVSVWGVRENALMRKLKPDYQERAYTFEQFKAFKQNNGAHKLKLDDARDDQNVVKDLDVAVEFETINFNFGINSLATGKFSAITGGWDSVYEHNHSEMIKFVGYLSKHGADTRGLPPSGFVGSVFERLDPHNPAQAAMMAKIQAQTDIVRELFVDEKFKKGNGDPAKMGTHILILQTLADQALTMVGATDQAATCSRGCKSDKDRGGVLDAEYKYAMMTLDMGGEVLPDLIPEGDDRVNYKKTTNDGEGSSVQTFNTGMPGSKEAGHLKERFGYDPKAPASPEKDEARKAIEYVMGLARFAPA